MNVVSLAAKRTRLSPPNPLIYFPVLERPLYWQAKRGPHGERNLYPSPDHKQLVRSDNGTPIPLAVVGHNYKVLQNEELFEAIEQNILDTLPPEKLVNVTVKDRMSYNGAMCMREYIFNDITAKVAGNNIAFRAIVQNGFGNSSVKIIVGAIEYYCTNGIIIGTADRKVRRHTSGLNVAALSSYITNSLNLFEKSAEQWCRWTKIGLTDKVVQRFFDELVDAQYLSERLSRRLYRRFQHEKSGRGSTLWALTSALTYYSSHDDEDQGFGVRKTERDHHASTMMGREEQVRKIIRSKYFQRLAA